MIAGIICSVLVGSMLWLDRVFMFQLFLSRPIVIASVLGLILGNIGIGLLVGASLELLWLNAPPVGAYLPNDDSFTAATAAPVAVYAAAFLNDAAAAGLALVLCLPISLLGRTLDMRLRTANETLLPTDKKNMYSAVPRAMAKALLRSYGYALIGLSCSVGFGVTMVHILKDILPTPVITACAIMPFASIVIGIAGLLVQEIPRPRQTGLFVLGMALVVIVTWML
ncbi:MAG TPA: hypothetical protein ENN34_07475 [Deltaproteobacteria bacterium]|nr:hypothetical protein [Deltaproteobacteria bacterium]